MHSPDTVNELDERNVDVLKMERIVAHHCVGAVCECV